VTASRRAGGESNPTTASPTRRIRRVLHHEPLSPTCPWRKVGLSTGRRAPLPRNEAPGVVRALSFLHFRSGPVNAGRSRHQFCENCGTTVAGTCEFMPGAATPSQRFASAGLALRSASSISGRARARPATERLREARVANELH
jgi:hypothetical protein